jgi:hypothetical protein
MLVKKYATVTCYQFYDVELMLQKEQNTGLCKDKKRRCTLEYNAFIFYDINFIFLLRFEESGD